MSKKELRSSGKPRRGGFANGRALNVTSTSSETILKFDCKVKECEVQ